MIFPLLAAISFTKIWVARVDAEFTDFEPCGNTLAFSTYQGFGQVSLEQGNKLWSAGMKEGQLGARVTSDGKMTVVCTGDGPIQAFDAITGKPRWSVPHKGYASPLALIGTTVYAESSPNILSAIDVTTHKVLWTVPIDPALKGVTEAQMSLRPTSTGSGILIGSRSGLVSCIEPASGAIRWSAFLSDSPVQSVLFDDERVYATTARGVVYGIGKLTGTLLWHYDVQNAVAGSPLLQDGRLLIVSPGGYVLCLVALSGQYLWLREFSKDQDFSVTGAIPQGKGILLMRRQGALNLDVIGRQNWEAPLPAPASFRTPILYKNDYIVFDSHAIFRIRPQ